MAVKNLFSLPIFLILSFSIAVIHAQFYAQYYASDSNPQKTFTQCFRQQVTSRVDSNINFKFDSNWNVLPGQLATKQNDFAVRWSGYLVPQETGKYEFGVRGDDGYVLTLDEDVLINAWRAQPSTTSWSAPQALLAGMKYKLRLEYFQAGGGAEITLLWKVNGGAEQVIPTDKVKPLTPNDEKTSVVNSKGWQTTFYRSRSTNTDMTPQARFTHFQSDRIDTDVNYPNWEQSWGSRGIQGSTDYFSTRWNGLLTPPADGTYNLHLMADDGVRLLVNGQPLIAGQSWNQVQSVKEYQATTTFRANVQYQITVEYFQMQGGAYSQLMWSSANLPKSIVGNAFVSPIKTTTHLNVVPFAGRRYAVLDGTDATLTTSSKQAEFKAIPPGWKICQDSAKTRLIAAAGKWGADGVVTDDGRVLRTNAIGELTGPSATNLESFDMDGTKVFRPNIDTNNRILIQSDNLSPGDVDVAVPTITSTVVFGNKRFAALDATNPASKPGVRMHGGSRLGNTFRKLPPGWSVAGQDAQTKVIMMGHKYSFGSKEVITNDGTSYDVTNGRPKAGAQMETVNADDGNYMRPVNPVDQTILIAQDAQGQPDSWQVVRTITNVARVRSGNQMIYYATLDNARPDETSQTCQDVPLGIPDGWSVANRNPAFDSQIINQNAYQFGARCLVFADGSGTYTVSGAGSCGNDLLARSNFNNRDLFAPTDCSVERKILIQKSVPLDQLPANDICGKCFFFGDPHVITFAGAQWTFALSRQASYTFLKPKSNLPQNFKIWTTNQPYKDVDSITDVYVQYNSETLRFQTNQQGDQNYQVFRNGRHINPDADNDPSAIMTPVKITDQINAEWTMWSLTLPNGILMWVGLQRWDNINLYTVYVYLPNSLRGATEGICGACGEDTMRWSNGQTIQPNADPNSLNQYAGSWTTTGGIDAGTARRKRQAPAITTVSVHSNNTCSNPHVKAMANIVCQGLDEQGKEACMIDYCASGSLQVVASAQKTAVFGRKDLAKEGKCPNTSIEITNFVNFQGYDFAVLDNTPNNTRTVGKQMSPLRVPSGWEIAPDTPLTRAFIACSSFGTTCFTLRNGIALTRDLKSCHKGMNNLRHTNDENCVMPTSSSRILIVRSNQVQFISEQARRFEDKNAWVKLGQGYNIVNGTDFSSMSLRLAAQTGQMAGAQFQSTTYESNRRFSIGIWSRVTRPFIQKEGSVYGMRVELSYAVGGNFTLAAFIPFNSTIVAFNFRHAEVVPTAVVKAIRLTLVVEGFEDIEADFSNIYVYGQAAHAGNLLKNPSVYNRTHWSVSKGLGFDVSYSVDHTGYDASGSIRMLTLGAFSKSKDFLATQVIRLTDEQAKGVRGIYFSGWSLQKSVGGSPASGYSIFVNLVFADGTKTTGVIAAFSEVLKGWQFSERVYRISESKQIKEIQFAVVFRRHTGTVYFDDMYLTLLPCVDYGSESIDIASGAIGLGHIVTMSGRIMDLPAPGDWNIFQDKDMTITGRYISEGSSALVLTSVSIKYGAIIIQVDRATGTTLPSIQLDGAVTKELTTGHLIEVGTVGSIVLGDSFDDQDGSASVFIDLMTYGHRIVVTTSVGDNKNQWLQVFPKPPLASLKTASGLMGKYDPNNYKSLVDAFDNVHPASYTPDAMDIAKWKVMVDSNILATSSPKPDPKATITRRDVSSYPSVQVDVASEACSGVALKESCMEDFLSTEGDNGMSYSYGTLEQLVTSAEPSDFVSKLSISDDDDDVDFDKRTFIIVSAAVGAAVVVVIAVLIVLVIKSRGSGKSYQVLDS